MPITSAFVETSRGTGKFDSLTSHAILALDAAGIPWTETSLKFIQRKRVEVTPHILVVGSIPTVHAALTQLGCPLPEPDDYPLELRAHLHRRVWKSVLHAVPAGHFVKPRRIKKFTGFISYGYHDPIRCNGASHNTPVWVSEPVQWVSEWRCFVAHGKIMGTQCYSGDPGVPIDLGVLEQAVQARTEPPWGYTLDLGVLDTGETALVEQNLGYSMDHYHLAPERYLAVLTAFWDWATSCPGPDPKPS